MADAPDAAHDDGAPPLPMQESIYDFVVKSIDGKTDVALSTYKGRVLLIVNVASLSPFTTINYTELVDLYNKYKDQNNFVVMAFPCNQFGNQEPGANDQIRELVLVKFKGDFPLFDKIKVNGIEEIPLYRYLKAQQGGGVLGDDIKWNFTKFLVDANGKVIRRYKPTINPTKIEANILQILPAPIILEHVEEVVPEPKAKGKGKGKGKK